MLAEPTCSKRNCKWLMGTINDGDETTERPACAAFPKGIPRDIAYGEDKHLLVRPGQENNVVYEPTTRIL